jgi:type I restriction-modification system DNA methylase subunit
MQTLNLDTLRKNAAKFAKEFESTKSEKQNDQDFMRGFCAIFGIQSRSIEWQYDVRENKKTAKKWIDGLIPSTLLFEIKSAGQNLDDAYRQAADYVPMIKESHRPDYILVSDFQNLHLYNRVTGAPRVEIKLSDLPQHIDHFLFLAGYEQLAIENQQKINEQAAEKMADLHDEIKKTGYDGKDLENYLVRLLFCLFAEDTGLFGENGAFLNYLHNHTKADGSDLDGSLRMLFDTLNTEPKKRAKNLPEHLAKFPYINGALFEGNLKTCYFDEATRNTLIECANLDWSDISPAIFGSLFQAVMHDEDEQGKAKTKKRREFGAHYTSEQNILKTIKPLFLDDLRAEFEKCSKQKLPAFHEKLAKLNFFDPACGCGNFLIVAYRELRLLEIEVIKKIYGNKLSQLDVGETLILCNVHQFHGIDIDESATHIATVAMWLVDHQMNLEVGKAFGNYFNRIPLVKKANIINANALQIDWQDVIKPKECSFIMGNPPFVGYSYQTKAQKDDLALVFQDMNGAGVLDLVAAWYVKAARYIQENPKIDVAFVSTNSICQGEQVSILWRYLFSQGVKIRFAYRTFKWSNEGRGVAAVHCIIVGFGLTKPKQRFIFDNDLKIEARTINQYLVEASIIFIEKRAKPLSIYTSEMKNGGKPTEGGHLLLSEEEADQIRQIDAIAAKYIRPFSMGDEFINNIPRYCLWLKDSTVHDRANSPEIKKRVEKVRQMRLASKKIATQKLAEIPYLFGEIRQPSCYKNYLAIPKVSSENRRFIPIGYLDSSVICGDKLFFVGTSSHFLFGILNSTMHNAWMRTVAGRLESRYSYSNTIVYNNFPFPENLKEDVRENIEMASMLLLAIRQAEFDRCEKQNQKCSLALLYNPLTMPADLVKAHEVLDKQVDAAYNYKGTKDDAARVAFLFEKYQELKNEKN